VVVPNGVGDEFSIDAHPGADEAAERLLGPRRPCDVLHVGSSIPRKRIEVLLRVFHALLRVQPAARLLRVGGPLTPAQVRLATALGLRDAMVELPPIDDHVLAAVYRRAYATLLPSAREGFGFPVAESLRCGTPVVATDLPVLREVGGVYASYCASDDEDAWVPAILGSRTDDGELDRRQALDRAAWAGRFTWRRYADQMLSIYEAVAERRPAPAELVHSLT
jgi:glycosyltransferase involved in cell wall biosynthesis